MFNALRLGDEVGKPEVIDRTMCGFMIGLCTVEGCRGVVAGLKGV